MVVARKLWKINQKKEDFVQFGGRGSSMRWHPGNCLLASSGRFCLQLRPFSPFPQTPSSPVRFGRDTTVDSRPSIGLFEYPVHRQAFGTLPHLFLWQPLKANLVNSYMFAYLTLNVSLPLHKSHLICHNRIQYYGLFCGKIQIYKSQKVKW